MKRVALVYQAGIANVFEVEDSLRRARRLIQADFRTCEAFARGCAAMGASVMTFACNVAGDCAGQDWSTDLDSAPFSDQFRPIMTD